MGCLFSILLARTADLGSDMKGNSQFDFSRPAFTVVVPTHNREALLPRAVASVLPQSFSDFELIVVDDGSTDGTLNLLHSVSDPRLRVISQSRAGVSAARNAGLRAATGDAVTFLDSDDEAMSDWLEKFADLFVDPMCGKLPRGRSLDGPLLANFETERDRIDTMMANRPGGRPSPQAAKSQKTAEASDR